MLTLRQIIFVSTFISALLSTAAAQEKPAVQRTPITITAPAISADAAGNKQAKAARTQRGSLRNEEHAAQVIEINKALRSQLRQIQTTNAGCIKQD